MTHHPPEIDEVVTFQRTLRVTTKRHGLKQSGNRGDENALTTVLNMSRAGVTKRLGTGGRMLPSWDDVRLIGEACDKRGPDPAACTELKYLQAYWLWVKKWETADAAERAALGPRPARTAPTDGNTPPTTDARDTAETRPPASETADIADPPAANSRGTAGIEASPSLAPSPRPQAMPLAADGPPESSSVSAVPPLPALGRTPEAQDASGLTDPNGTDYASSQPNNGSSPTAITNPLLPEHASGSSEPKSSDPDRIQPALSVRSERRRRGRYVASGAAAVLGLAVVSGYLAWPKSEVTLEGTVRCTSGALVQWVYVKNTDPSSTNSDYASVEHVSATGANYSWTGQLDGPYKIRAGCGAQPQVSGTFGYSASITTRTAALICDDLAPAAAQPPHHIDCVQQN